jgi:cytochrome c oxidase cbb3-type subunit 2
MPRSAPDSGWRGVTLIAITYIYFLIFAQFAFLNRLAALGIAGTHLKAVMAAMAAGGILFSLLTPRASLYPSPALRLRTGLALSGAAALLTLLPLALPASIVVAFLVGAGLGILTVTLVTHLRSWLGLQNALLKVGFGTGIGYLICNIPFLFDASPRLQAIVAAALCLVGIFCASEQNSETDPPNPSDLSFFRVLTCFTALVWLDSAAFFIIQKTPELKEGTWEGAVHLWSNGSLHLLAALAGAWCLRKFGLSASLTLAFLALGSACLLLLNPSRAVAASIFYPIGVSLYSVALVAYPSLLAPVGSAAQRGRLAGWIYAIAGWGGSAMGIGMGQNLRHVPVMFVALAGACILIPPILRFLAPRRVEILATLTILALAYCIERAAAPADASSPPLSAVEQGRQVYVSEGCISCHSQYVRPNTPDVLMWGPVETVEEIHRQRPPLIGNRRQGPDLANVGNRRSPLWLKAHFYNPSELSHASFMPSYAYLFADHRGNHLIAYLQSLNADNDRQRALHQAWRPSSKGDVDHGEGLFDTHCSTCHLSNGLARTRWHAGFRRLPPDLLTGPYLHLPFTGSLAARRDRIAGIVKFGIRGTDMPGHEYMSDDQIASISSWLARVVALPVSTPQLNTSLEQINENRQ